MLITEFRHDPGQNHTWTHTVQHLALGLPHDLVDPHHDKVSVTGRPGAGLNLTLKLLVLPLLLEDLIVVGLLQGAQRPVDLIDVLTD